MFGSPAILVFKVVSDGVLGLQYLGSAFGRGQSWPGRTFAA